MVLNWPIFSLMFLIHVFSFAGVNCITAVSLINKKCNVLEGAKTRLLSFLFDNHSILIIKCVSDITIDNTVIFLVSPRTLLSLTRNPCETTHV